MSGEELKKKIDATGIPQAKLAEMMGIFPQSFNKTLKADDVRSGFIEKLCAVTGKEITFFYGRNAIKPEYQPQQNQSVPYFMYRDLQDRYEASVRENQSLREKLAKYDDDAVGKRVV